MPESIRSFIAFDVDSAEVVDRLAGFQHILSETEADLKIVKPENIHVTLHFLGNITASTAESVFEEMKKVEFAPFNIKIADVGVFPNLKYPRIVWAGVTEGANQISGIFRQLEPRLQKLGFPPDSRGFSPHLTIARVKSGRNKSELVRRITENSKQEFGIIEAECLRLKRSNLTPKGPIYSTMYEFCPKR